MIILVDTNVWIDFLLGKAYTSKLSALIRESCILRHDWVEAELRLGNIPKNRNFFIDYNNLSTAKNPSLNEIFDFVENKNLHSKGLSFIDIGILLSAINVNCHVWTRDTKLKELAQKFNLDFEHQIL